MKSGDHLVCEVSSQDLWLDLKIEADRIGVVIFFEIKVLKTATVLTLKQSLIDIANQLFSLRIQSAVYGDDECQLKKINLTGKESVLSTETVMVLDQSQNFTNKTEEIDNRVCIGNAFGYLDRYALLRLEKKQEEGRERSITMPSCTLSDSLMHITSTMPIRNLRVEPQIITRNRRSAHISDRNDDHNDQNNCNCQLL